MPERSRIAGLLAGALLVIAGASILYFGIPGAGTDPSAKIQYRTISEFTPGAPGFPQVQSRFPIRKINRVAVLDEQGQSFAVDVAYYRNIANQPRQAMIYLSEQSSATTPPEPGSDLNRLRSEAWLDAMKSLPDPNPGNRVFMTWWDNAQRIDLLSGQTAWVASPVGEAFDRPQQEFWRYVSGGFGQQDQRLQRLAAWLLSDAGQALRSMEKAAGAGNDLYLLVTIDDLARWSEMQALSGNAVPFETRLFRVDQNIHRLISRVKRWAREKGNGSYLVQHLTGTGVRVWRITSDDGEKLLLARLLPFTSSLANPIANLDLVHRSNWSGFISIYRWNASRSEKAQQRR